MVTHEHAVEVDEKLAALWEQHFDLERTLGWKVEKLHEVLEERRERDRRTFQYGPWPTTTEEAVELVRALAATAPDQYPNGYDRVVWQAMAAKKALADFREALAAVRANEAAQQPLDAEYRAERWSRFFLVQNTGGHIHSSMHCATTFPTTRWAWLPSLSGLGEDAAVEQEGPRLCSVCFPSAPVEWTLGLPKKLNPKRCDGSGQKALDVNYRYHTPRGRCAVCGTGVAASRTGLARPHNKPA